MKFYTVLLQGTNFTSYHLLLRWLEALQSDNIKVVNALMTIFMKTGMVQWNRRGRSPLGSCENAIVSWEPGRHQSFKTDFTSECTLISCKNKRNIAIINIFPLH